MGFYRYLAFVGAACMAVNLFPFVDYLGFYLEGVGALCALLGACYYLIKVDEYRYGIIMILVCVACQPLFDLGLTPFMEFVIDIFSVVIFMLTGILAGRFEKQIELDRARAQAEIESLQRREAEIRRRINSQQ